MKVLKNNTYAAVTIITLSIALFFSAQSAGVASAQPFQDITIYSDGYIDPPSAPISTSDYSTYSFTDNIYGRIWIYCDDILLDGEGFTLQGQGILTDVGIDLEERDNITIQNIQIKTCNQGIRVDSCSHINLYENQITNSSYGVWIDSSSYSSICSNNVSANDFGGLLVYSSSNNIFSNNTISDDGNTGFTLVGSNNTVSGNTLNNNEFTLMLNSYFEPCQNNSISDNNISCSDYGMWFSSQSNPYTIRNNNVTGNYITSINIACVTLEYCANNIFAGNHLSSDSGGFGYGVEYSCNNTFFANTITNTSVGFGLAFSSDCNSVCGNNITNTAFGGTGISFTRSNDNVIAGNNLADGFCVTLESSSNNHFYYNNFYATADYVYDLSWIVKDMPASVNTWDNGALFGGNYWGNYATKYPAASEVNNSGIWNTPYVIDTQNKDNYPLTQPHATSENPEPIHTPSPPATPTPPPTSPPKTSSPTSSHASPTHSADGSNSTPSAPEFSPLTIVFLLLIGGLITVVTCKRVVVRRTSI